MFDMLLQRGHIDLGAGVWNNKRLWSLQAVIVQRGDNGCLQHIGVRCQRLFDLERRNPLARDLEHVVRAPAIDVAAIGSAEIFVAGA